MKLTMVPSPQPARPLHHGRLILEIMSPVDGTGCKLVGQGRGSLSCSISTNVIFLILGLESLRYEYLLSSHLRKEFATPGVDTH